MSYSNKSIELLELPAILKCLSEFCCSEGAKEKALTLQPAEYSGELERRLGDTSAAVELMRLKGSPGFSGLKDMSASLRRADLGGCLSTEELLNISDVLQCTRTAALYAKTDRTEASSLDGLFSQLVPNKNLEDRIKAAIIAPDEIADSASSELYSIRRKIRQESANIRSSLQRIISSPEYAKALQEPIVTMRGGRFVVPVKLEYKNVIQGLVHDVSSSGMTLFIEPMSAVKSNNELKELQAREKAEIERILAELSAICAACKNDIASNIQILTELDFIFAKAKLSYKMNAMECGRDSKTGIVLKKARHPLLNNDTVVPIDIDIGSGFDTLVITGPNTGGKTVTLKTLGLLALMNSCGLHVPAADGTNIPVFTNVLADIGDEQSIAQSLSTFSAHMTNIVSIIQEATEGSLVLFDELGAGTDPIEGAALAIAIIENIRLKKALVAATTHYSELKLYALNTDGVRNASCEFDIKTLRPTYRILMGLPGKSNAFAISEKLGLPGSIIENAENRIDSGSADFEKTVSTLDTIREELEQEKREIDKKLLSITEQEKKASFLRAELEVRLEKADIKARREAQRIIEEAKDTAEEVFRKLDEMEKNISAEADANVLNEERNKLRKKLNEAEKAPAVIKPVEADRVSSRPPKTGDTVLIKSMNLKAQVIAVLSDGTLSLRAGIINVNAKPAEVLLLEDDKPAAKSHNAANSPKVQLRAETMSNQIDLRGMESLEAVYVAEQYLDSAVMGGLKSVYLIHGKGTGALRSAVQQMLKKNKLVRSFRPGLFGEGENGVTVVELK